MEPSGQTFGELAAVAAGAEKNFTLSMQGLNQLLHAIIKYLDVEDVDTSTLLTKAEREKERVEKERVEKERVEKIEIRLQDLEGHLASLSSQISMMESPKTEQSDISRLQSQLDRIEEKVTREMSALDKWRSDLQDIDSRINRLSESMESRSPAKTGEVSTTAMAPSPPRSPPSPSKPRMLRSTRSADSVLQAGGGLKEQALIKAKVEEVPESSELADKMVTLENSKVAAEEKLAALEKSKVAAEEKLAALERAKVADDERLAALQKITDYHARVMPDLWGRMVSCNSDIRDIQEDRLREKKFQERLLLMNQKCLQLNNSAAALMEDFNKDKDAIFEKLGLLEYMGLEQQVGIELNKSDRQAMESKVSRATFDATTEQLNNMIQKLLVRVSGQEEDWHGVVEKMNAEMKDKLDRMELSPLTKQLEEHWNAICQQLKDRPPHFEADEAAAIRKQLTAKFNCLSCDRDVSLKVPEEKVLTLPRPPAVPSRQPRRRFTAFQLHDLRQSSDNPGCGGFPTVSPHKINFALAKDITPLPKIKVVLSKESTDIRGSDGCISQHGTKVPKLPKLQTTNGESGTSGRKLRW